MRRRASETIQVVVLLTFCIFGSAHGDPILFHPGTGVPNPGEGDSRAMWSEPPDLNGMLASSEQILQYQLETEIANDFVPTETTVTHATWWGGYFNNGTPCQAGITAPGFNLEFFEDANCVPGDLSAYLVVTNFTEESVGCQSGEYPLYKYGADVSVSVVSGGHYWFCAQMRDHAFPPQWGRLASIQVIECNSVFRSLYWGYPDWTDWCDYWQCPDFSQEFDGDHSEACCFPDGHCEFILTGACAADGGTAQGPGSVCDPNPCGPTPAQPSSWGSVKRLFRDAAR